MTYSYAFWTDYLAKGRKKYERTLYDRGYYIRRANRFKQGGDYEIYQKYDPSCALVTIHPDDTFTINSQPSTYSWGGGYTPLMFYSNRLTVQRYAGVEVVVRKRVLQIIERDAQRKPVKLQGCRECKQTGKTDLYCYPSHCWNISTNLVGKPKCEDHPDFDLSLLSPNKRWHYVPCEHGKHDMHVVPRGGTCGFCNGAKKREYGGQIIMVPWDGSPIRVQNGNIYKQPLTELERMVAAYAGPTPIV